MAEDLLVDIFLLSLYGRVSSDRNSHVRLLFHGASLLQQSECSYVMVAV